MSKRKILLLATICAFLVWIGPVRVGLVMVAVLLLLYRTAPYLIVAGLVFWYFRRRRRRL